MTPDDGDMMTAHRRSRTGSAVQGDALKAPGGEGGGEEAMSVFGAFEANYGGPAAATSLSNPRGVDVTSGKAHPGVSCWGQSRHSSLDTDDGWGGYSLVKCVGARLNSKLS